MRRSFISYLLDNFLWVLIFAIIAGTTWLCAEYKQPFYQYKVKVIFCDGRSPREVSFKDFRCPGIDYKEEGRYGAQALSTFEYETSDGNRTLLNVCEVQILHKTYIGDYTLINHP